VGLPDDTTMTLHGDADGARRLADQLLERGFDVRIRIGSGPIRRSRTPLPTPSCSWTIPTPDASSPIG